MHKRRHLVPRLASVEILSKYLPGRRSGGTATVSCLPAASPFPLTHEDIKINASFTHQPRLGERMAPRALPGSRLLMGEGKQALAQIHFHPWRS